MAVKWIQPFKVVCLVPSQDKSPSPVFIKMSDMPLFLHLLPSDEHKHSFFIKTSNILSEHFQCVCCRTYLMYCKSSVVFLMQLWVLFSSRRENTLKKRYYFCRTFSWTETWSISSCDRFNNRNTGRSLSQTPPNFICFQALQHYLFMLCYCQTFCTTGSLCVSHHTHSRLRNTH